MNFKGFVKKQGVAFWISLAAIVLTIVGFILYAVALNSGMDLDIANGSQPFYQKSRDEDAVMMVVVTTCGILALVALVASMVLSQFESKEGLVGKVCSIASDVLRSAAPILLMLTAIYFVYGSFTGLGWTFFSNSELKIYAQAISTGKTVIIGVVFFLVAAIASLVGTFFKEGKKVEDLTEE